MIDLQLHHELTRRIEQLELLLKRSNNEYRKLERKYDRLKGIKVNNSERLKKGVAKATEMMKADLLTTGKVRYLQQIATDCDLSYVTVARLSSKLKKEYRNGT